MPKWSLIERSLMKRDSDNFSSAKTADVFDFSSIVFFSISKKIGEKPRVYAIVAVKKKTIFLVIQHIIHI